VTVGHSPGTKGNPDWASLQIPDNPPVSYLIASIAFHTDTSG